MIKTLLFDFGDVFINLDKLKPYEEFKQIGFGEPTSEMLQFNQNYEVGNVNTNEFLDYYVKHSAEQISTNDVKKAWNSILLDFPEHRLKFIQELASVRNFKLILLSNTNDLHINWIKENIPFYYDFKVCFDEFYLSQEIQLRKPNEDIFEFVLEQNDILAEETLFIDDTKDNTDTAKRLGFHTWNNNPKTEDVVDIFTINQQLF